MAASEFLATRTEGDARNPLRAAFYTGVAYLVTVFLLVMPYLALQPDSPELLGLSVLHQALGATLLIGVGIVGAFGRGMIRRVDPVHLPRPLPRGRQPGRGGGAPRGDRRQDAVDMPVRGADRLLRGRAVVRRGPR